MEKNRIRWHIADILWLLPAALAVIAGWLLQDQQLLVEDIYVPIFFKSLSVPISVFSSLVPISMTELLLVTGVMLAIVVLIIGLYRLLRRLFGKPVRPRVIPFKKVLRILLYVVSIAYLMFTLLHGLNYMRQPVADSFGLAVRPRTTEELTVVTEKLAQAASEARTHCLEDEQGIFMLRDGIRSTLNQTAQGYAASAVDWPLVSGPPIRPKGVLLSHLWSYTGISGLYFPFLVEANVNIDQPDYTIPDTAGHEIAHTRGFAREDEAGFISFLTGLSNPNPDFRYSVLANAYVRCVNALYAQDKDAYEKTASLVSEGMSRDLADNSRYWQQFAGPVSEVSEQINNSYLIANKQTDGVRSYGRMIDLVLAYHEFNGGKF